MRSSTGLRGIMWRACAKAMTLASPTGAAALFAGRSEGGLGAHALDAEVALGDALALGCAFVWSSYSVLSRRLKAAPTEAVAGFCLATSALERVPNSQNR